MTTPFVQEITMAAPNIVCVIVRDPGIVRGDMVPVASPPDAGANQSIFSRLNPNTGVMAPARVIGTGNTYLKFLDTRATNYLDRTAAKVAGNYGTIGARTVQRVRMKSLPYDFGVSAAAAGGDNTASAVSMEHFLYLVLDGNLAAGSYTITFPAGTGLSSTAFNFDPVSTRCSSIRGNQVGYRSKDQKKAASLSLWLPQETAEGDTDFMGTYSLTTFKVINASNAVKYQGPITKRVGPADVEPGVGSNFASGIRYASTQFDPLTITSISKATVPVVGYSGSGYVPANADVLLFRGIAMSGSPSLEGAYVTIQNVNTTAHTFEIASFIQPYATTGGQSTAAFGTFGASAYSSSYGQLAYKTRVANRAATSVFELDFSTANLLTGVYRISIDGLGCSDPFRIDESVYMDLAKNSFKGFVNQLSGIALDGSIAGYVKPVDFKDGVNGHACFRSNLPACFSSEWLNSYFSGTGYTQVDSEAAGSSPYVTATRATGIYGEVHDAADWDCYTIAHVPMAISLLTLGYENLPSGVRGTAFGFPKSSVTLDGSLYAGTDPLPDAVHQAIWVLDFYRRLQDTSTGQITSGAVGSGRGYSRFSGATGFGGGGHTNEPSWIYSGTSFIYAADQASNYMYAGGAAALAKTLSDAGFTTAATTWLNSAVAAWNWAESVYQRTKGHSIVTTGAVGTFARLETITGGTSGATAIVYFNGATKNNFDVITITGTFQNGETITGGTSLNTATLSSLTMNASINFDYYFNTSLNLLGNNRSSLNSTGSSTSGSLVLTALTTTGMVVGNIMNGPGLATDKFAISTIDISSGSNAGQVTLIDTTVTGLKATTTQTGGTYFFGWSNTQYNCAMSAVFAVADVHRTESSGLMYRATGDQTTYGSIIQAVAGAGIIGIEQGVWAFVNTSGADATAKATFQNSLKSNPSVSTYLAYIEQSGLSYKNMQAKDGSGSIRTDSISRALYFLIYAYLTDATITARVCKGMQDSLSFVLGANQVGKSLITGVGVRSTICTLNKDWEYSGQQPHAGIMAYAFDNLPWGSNYVSNFTTDAAVNGVVEYPTPTGGSDFGLARTAEPYRKSFPWMEAFFEHPNMIFMEEYQVQSCCVPQQIAFMHLQAMTQAHSRTMTLRWG